MSETSDGTSAASAQAPVLNLARQLSADLQAAGVEARFIGGVGVALRVRSPLPPPLTRDYADFDIVVNRVHSTALSSALPRIGYEPSRRFNALHGRRRMLFEDRTSARRVDVFVGEFAMCHVLSFDGRMPADHPAAYPSDLLLTKMQIVQINLKDLRDTAALLIDHDLGTFAEGKDAAEDRVLEITSRDWGWFTTVHDNLAKLRQYVSESDDVAGYRPVILGNADRLIARMEESPKSLRWRARARLGRRAVWYEEPDDVG